jgi:putative nucleotidyltransferase with HDIG domain
MERFSNLPEPVKMMLRKVISDNKELQEQNRELQRKVREISLLNEMSRLLNESDREHFYQTILELALKVSNSELGGIFLCQPGSGKLYLQVTLGEWEEELESWLEEMAAELDRFMARGEMCELISPNPFLLEMQKRDIYIKSALFFPLTLGREAYGMGLVMHRHQELITHSAHYEEDTRFLAILAQQATLVAELNHLKFDRQTEQIYLKTIAALTEAIDAKDMYTAGHSQRVAEISTAIAYELGLTQKEIDTVHYGALLHDIGKIGIPETILNKKGKLSAEEFLAIKKHPVIGTNILKSIDFLDDALMMVRYHHERFDGAGYPDGLKGEDIPFMARIVGIADAWDAMTSDRSYRAALSFGVAVQELAKNAGSQFDPLIVQVLQRGAFAQLKAV